MIEYTSGKDQHPVLLRGLNINVSSNMYQSVPTSTRPLILERCDDAFIDVLLSELGSERFELSHYDEQLPRDKEGNLIKLYQPIHKIYNLVVFEVVCDRFGEPRLDPKNIDSAGIVVRRRQSGKDEGWVSINNQHHGWMPVNTLNGLEIDPDPVYRKLSLQTGSDELDKAFSLTLNPNGDQLTETFTSLFVAPPEVCQLRGKTILYGMVPVTSSEFSETTNTSPLDLNGDARFDTALLSHLTTYLRRPLEGSSEQPIGSLNRAGDDINYLDATDSRLELFMINLRQLAIEFDTFGENTVLLNHLNTLSIELSNKYEPLGNYLNEAHRILLVADQTGLPVDEDDLETFEMGKRWPTITQNFQDVLMSIIKDTVHKRAQKFFAGTTRFGERGKEYFVKGFIRVKQPNGCPPVTTWSGRSDYFHIAEWFDTSEKTPITPIGLPDLSNRDNLKNLKPNVAFQVPNGLFNLINNNSPEDFLEGEPKEGGNLALDWICSFSIPIITICAFIVLSIFLALFDIIFRWLLFIKVCIPIPKGLVSDS